MKRTALVLIGLLLLFLTGCIDYSEELWLKKDGSGRVEAVIGVLTAYENPEEINRYMNQPGINLISKSVYRKKNFTYYKLDFTFNSLEAFNNLSDQISNADFFGRINLVKEKDGTITLKRRIALGSLSGEEDEIEQLIFTQAMEKLKWSYKLHLPWQIVKANAAPINIDYATNTVSWEYKTSFLWNKSQTMVVKMKQTYPFIPIVLVALAVVVIVLSLLWWKRHLKKMLKKLNTEVTPEQAKE